MKLNALLPNDSLNIIKKDKQANFFLYHQNNLSVSKRNTLNNLNFLPNCTFFTSCLSIWAQFFFSLVTALLEMLDDQHVSSVTKIRKGLKVVSMPSVAHIKSQT